MEALKLSTSWELFYKGCRKGHRKINSLEVGFMLNSLKKNDSQLKHSNPEEVMISRQHPIFHAYHLDRCIGGLSYSLFMSCVRYLLGPGPVVDASCPALAGKEVETQYFS